MCSFLRIRYPSLSFGTQKAFLIFDTSSILELSNRMQWDSHDNLMTEPEKPSTYSFHAVSYPGSVSIVLRAGIAVATILLAGCSRLDHTPNDWARELIPAGSVIIQDTDWTIGTWSARKSYVFESRMKSADYRSWIEGRFGNGWHCRTTTASMIAYSRLTPTEQQFLEIRAEPPHSQSVRFRITYTVTPT